MIIITIQKAINARFISRAIPPVIKPATAIGLPVYCCGFLLIWVNATTPSITASKPNTGPPQIHPKVILMIPKINEATGKPCCAGRVIPLNGAGGGGGTQAGGDSLAQPYGAGGVGVWGACAT